MSVRFTVYDAEDNVVEDFAVEGTHEDGHDEGRCDMWCQRCYVECCGAPEQPTRKVRAMSVYEQDPGGIKDVIADDPLPMVRWRRRRYTADTVEVFVDPRGKAEVRYVDRDGELLSDEALKAPNHLEQGRKQAIEECVRFLEEEANVADRYGDIAGAHTLRKSLRRMREKVKP